MFCINCSTLTCESVRQDDSCDKYRYIEQLESLLKLVGNQLNMQVHVYVVPMNDNQQTLATKCLMQLEELEIRPSKIFRNLAVPELLEVAIHRMEGELSITGALSVKTGKFTGRSPDDRYIVDDNITHDIIEWGKVNHQISEEKFENIFGRMKKYIEGKAFFVFDGFVGA